MTRQLSYNRALGDGLVGLRSMVGNWGVAQLVAADLDEPVHRGNCLDLVFRPSQKSWLAKGGIF
jgi:hypothetical protein